MVRRCPLTIMKLNYKSTTGYPENPPKFGNAWVENKLKRAF